MMPMKKHVYGNYTIVVFIQFYKMKNEDFWYV